jgi:hypothetical protein
MEGRKYLWDLFAAVAIGFVIGKAMEHNSNRFDDTRRDFNERYYDLEERVEKLEPKPATE